MLRCQFSSLFVAAVCSACGLNTNGIDTDSASESTGTTSITDADPPTSSATGDGTPSEVACIDDTGTIPDGFRAADYSFSLSVTGGAPPYSWEAKNLPPGLELTADPDDTTKAVLAGTPSETGAFDLEIVVTDDNGDATTTHCGELLIHESVQVDHDLLLTTIGGCISVGDDAFDSLVDLRAQGLLVGDEDIPVICELAPGRGNGSGNFDKDSDTSDTMPPGITLEADTCSVGGSVIGTLAYGVYGFIVTYTQSTSASTVSAHIPYCAANTTQTPTAYGVLREDTGNVATFLPGVQLLGPGEGVDYGTDVPDPKVTVDYGMPCMGGSCFYAFVFSYNTLSGYASVSASPIAKFPDLGFEGFTHGIRLEDADPDLLDRFADRAWVVNITFDYCIAPNDSDCGNDEDDPTKRAEKVRQNGGGTNYYFSLVLLPAD